MNQKEIYELGLQVLEKSMEAKAAHMAVDEAFHQLNDMKQELKEELLQYHEEFGDLECFTAKGDFPFKVSDWESEEYGDYLTKGDLRVSVSWSRRQSKTMQDLEEKLEFHKSNAKKIEAKIRAQNTIDLENGFQPAITQLKLSLYAS
tara:strand:- start:74 stop:514 length:441 start_codon:yes stop_codon:yes gene_type:complete